MILSSFDNTLKQIASDKNLMANVTCFNVVKDLMAMVHAVQALASANQGSNDILQVNISAKLTECESIITTFGMQRLAACGALSGGNQQQMHQQPQPFTPNTQMHNQNFYYPTMGQMQQAPMPQQPQVMAQPQQQITPMPQPQVMAQPQQIVQQPVHQPTPMPQPQPVQQPQVAPQPAPQMQQAPAAPQPIQQPQPQFTPQEQSAQQAPASGGESIMGFSSLPGMGGGGGGDKPAVGRDYILKLLNE
ncbi:MAG: hypothetical protein FWE45_05135 [Firmicutes bacterium]|nr:hypothetical protein [Bacillota bacterium]